MREDGRLKTGDGSKIIVNGQGVGSGKQNGVLGVGIRC